MSPNLRLLRIWAIVWGMLCIVSGHAFGQVVGPYQNTSVVTINGTTQCGGGEFTRVINVPAVDVFVIGDLDVGFLASHSWRGDIRLELTSPAGTNVRLINDDTSSTGNPDNVNVRMDDSAGTVIYTAPHNTNDGLVAPPYENLVSPHNALSVFNGESGAGNWTLTICDNFPGADNGQFRSAELFFTEAIGADLQLTLGANDTTPNIGTNVILTYTVSHAGPVTADGISVSNIIMPSGLTYVSDNGGGAFNSGTGVWTVPGSLLNSSASLQVTAFVGASGSFALNSEIATSNQADPDSTPGNGSITEDDFAALTLVPVTPAVPVLSCPGAPSTMDWDSEVWNAGDMSNSYTVASEAITITVVDANSALLSNAGFGGQTPAEATQDTGGLLPAESGLHFLADQPNRAGTVDVTIDLGVPGVGVEKFQVSLFDIDKGGFEDQVTVTGTLGGVAVPLTLFTSSANSASGTVVTGTAGAGNTSATGNMTIEYGSPVDKIVIGYGNGSGADANPPQQGMAIHDFSFCPVLTAVLTANKTAAVYDPLSEGLYMVPGNDVIYAITFTNTGDGAADADSVVLIDVMPTEIEFYNGDIDDGGPETNPVSGADSGSGLTFTYATDVRYSNSGTKPANYVACAYSPSAGYDPNITFICFNPKGAMAAGAPDPSFELKFRARIK